MKPNHDKRARRAVRAAALVASAALLAACGGDEHSDLKSELDRMTKDMRGRIEKLPEVKPYEPVAYKAEKDPQGKETFALVKAGSNLYRVRKGNYMGQNFGVITAIDEGQVSLKELVQDGGGEWIERQSSLQLQEARK